jgi:hypothetical protein
MCWACVWDERKNDYLQNTDRETHWNSEKFGRKTVNCS